MEKSYISFILFIKKRYKIDISIRIIESVKKANSKFNPPTNPAVIWVAKQVIPEKLSIILLYLEVFLVRLRIIKNLIALPYNMPAKSPIIANSIMKPKKLSFIPKNIIISATKVIEIDDAILNLVIDHKLALYTEMV